MQGYSDLVRVGGRVKGGLDIDAFLLTVATDVQKFLHYNKSTFHCNRGTSKPLLAVK